MASMSAEDRIVCVEMSTDRRGDGFLSDIRMTSSMDQSPLMTSRQFFFGLANNLHRAIKRNDLFVGHDCQCSQRQETRDVFSERGVWKYRWSHGSVACRTSSEQAPINRRGTSDWYEIRSGPAFGELNSAVSPPVDSTFSEYRRLPRSQLGALRVCVSVTIAETAPRTGAFIRPL